MKFIAGLYLGSNTFLLITINHTRTSGQVNHRGLSNCIIVSCFTFQVVLGLNCKDKCMVEATSRLTNGEERSTMICQLIPDTVPNCKLSLSFKQVSSLKLRSCLGCFCNLYLNKPPISGKAAASCRRWTCVPDRDPLSRNRRHG